MNPTFSYRQLSVSVLLACYLVFAPFARAAVAANNIILTQRNAGNTDNTPRYVAATNNAIIGLNGSGVPIPIIAGDGITIAGGTINASGSGNVTNNGTLTAGNIIMGDGTTVVKATGFTVSGGTITAPTNTDFTIATLDNDKPIVITPNGAGHTVITGASLIGGYNNSGAKGLYPYVESGGIAMRAITPGVQYERLLLETQSLVVLVNGTDTGLTLAADKSATFTSTVSATGYKVGATSGVSGTITAASTVTVVNGIITAISP